MNVYVTAWNDEYDAIQRELQADAREQWMDDHADDCECQTCEDRRAINTFEAID